MHKMGWRHFKGLAETQREGRKCMEAEKHTGGTEKRTVGGVWRIGQFTKPQVDYIYTYLLTGFCV